MHVFRGTYVTCLHACMHVGQASDGEKQHYKKEPDGEEEAWREMRGHQPNRQLLEV